MWCVAELNETYVSRVEDLLELYQRPQNAEQPVVCLDEKPVTLHADIRPSSPAKSGRKARRDNEYTQCGTANVYCAVEFAKVVVDLALQCPTARTIHLVMVNLNIHRPKSLTDLLGSQIGGEVWRRLAQPGLDTPA